MKIFLQIFQGISRPPSARAYIKSIRLEDQAELYDIEADFLRANAYAYFCGYLYLKIFKTHNCSQQLPYLEEENISFDIYFIQQRQIDRCNLIKPQ